MRSHSTFKRSTGEKTCKLRYKRDRKAYGPPFCKTRDIKRHGKLPLEEGWQMSFNPSKFKVLRVSNKNPLNKKHIPHLRRNPSEIEQE